MELIRRTYFAFYCNDCEADGDADAIDFDGECPKCGSMDTHVYREPAIARCSCGARITLSDPLDNECGSCGRCCNSSGQEVVPSWDCDEQGNPYDGD